MRQLETQTLWRGLEHDFGQSGVHALRNLIGCTLLFWLQIHSSKGNLLACNFFKD